MLMTGAQRDLPVNSKRKLHIIGGARGLWSLPIRQSVRASGISYEKAMNPYHSEPDTLILSTDINPSPGLSRVRRLFFDFMVIVGVVLAYVYVVFFIDCDEV